MVHLPCQEVAESIANTAAQLLFSWLMLSRNAPFVIQVVVNDATNLPAAAVGMRLRSSMRISLIMPCLIVDVLPRFMEFVAFAGSERLEMPDSRRMICQEHLPATAALSTLILPRTWPSATVPWSTSSLATPPRLSQTVHG